MRRVAAKIVPQLLHAAYIVQEFLAINKMAVVPHPLYSPDLSPRDFFLFPKMKIKFKRKCRRY
jgi:hypothetical protein